MPDLKGKRVAVLATDGVEQVELTEPVRALREAGAEPVLVSLAAGEIQAVNHMDRGDTFRVEQTLADADTGGFDALVLPGGVMNPDQLRQSPDAVAFARSFVEQGKPVAAICHGPWLLVEADVVDGRTLTSYPSLRTDIENAGGTWVDERVHVDQGLVTSRKPDDLEAFCAKLLEEVAEGRHAARQGD